MSVKDLHKRLTQIINNQYQGQKNLFCRKNNIKEGTFYSMFKKGTNPSFDTIHKILTNHPNISSDWLILGKGNYNRTSFNDLKKELVVAKQEIEYLKKINSLLENQK